jgi:PAS domain S-box-containing protein
MLRSRLPLPTADEAEPTTPARARNEEVRPSGVQPSGSEPPPEPSPYAAYEDELRELRALLAALQREQAVIAFDASGRISYANQNFLSALGYRADELRGRHHGVLVPADERDSPEYQAFWRALVRGQPQARRFRHVAKDGRDVWLQAVYNPMFDGEGRVVKVVTLATDISNAVAAERINERYASMSDHASLGLMFADLSGVIQYANPAAKACLSALPALGLHPDEAVGARIARVLHAPGHPALDLADESALPVRVQLRVGREAVARSTIRARAASARW